MIVYDGGWGFLLIFIGGNIFVWIILGLKLYSYDWGVNVEERGFAVIFVGWF